MRYAAYLQTDFKLRRHLIIREAHAVQGFEPIASQTRSLVELSPLLRQLQEEQVRPAETVH